MQATIMLDVMDVEASSRWYQRLLACQSGHGGADFEMLVDGELLLLMLHRRQATNSVPLGVGVTLYVRVDDIGAVARRATEMGVEHVGVCFNELSHQEELALKDPDGYAVTICRHAQP